MRAALDTNILVYAEGVNGPVRQRSAAALLDRLLTADLVIPVQVLGELLHVLRRKAGIPRAEAQNAVLVWLDGYEITPTTLEGFVRANDLVANHQISIWDAVILAAAAEAQCDLLLSEDMQDGFAWGGVVVANPFADRPHPLLRRLLGSQSQS